MSTESRVELRAIDEAKRMATQRLVVFIVIANLVLTAVADIRPWSFFRGTLQNNIGYAYWRGVVVSKDEDKAIYWFRKAVDADNGSAANNLANLYEVRPYMTVDKETLIYLYRIAAAHGIATAQNNLGVLLIKEDPREAALWFRKAAASRDVSVAQTAEDNLAAIDSR
jgi:TPR repeat protein